MATYSLSGSGTQTLTTGVTALHVTISTLPAGAGHGLASPTDYWGIGSLRPGNATAFWEPFVICGGPQWLAVPFGTTRLGYAFADTAVVSVAEVFGSYPLSTPLAGLPDVALSSPADAQVLAYQASSSKWINATPTSGGGGGSGAFTLITRQTVTGSAATTITFSSIPATYNDLHIRFQVKATGGAQFQQMKARLNNISTATYFQVQWDSAGLGATATDFMTVGYCAGGRFAGHASSGTIDVVNYSATAFWKQMVTNIYEGDLDRRGSVGGRNSDTAAVNRIDFFLDANQFAIGSMFALYGVS